MNARTSDVLPMPASPSRRRAVRLRSALRKEHHATPRARRRARGGAWAARGRPITLIGGSSVLTPVIASSGTLGSAERDNDCRRSEPEPRCADRRGREGVRPLLLVDAGRDKPDRGRRCRGPVLLGLRRQALPRLRVTARQRQHRPPAPEDHRGDQGAGRQALHDRAADGERVALAPRPDARRGDARRPLHVLLHELGRRGERERDQARAALHRSEQDHRPLPLLPRGDTWVDLADGRPAPLADRARDARRRADARPLHVPLPGRPSRSVPRLHGRAAPRGDPPVRGRAHRRSRDPGDRHRDERRHSAAAGLPAGDP